MLGWFEIISFNMDGLMESAVMISINRNYSIPLHDTYHMMAGLFFGIYCFKWGSFQGVLSLNGSVMVD